MAARSAASTPRNAAPTAVWTSRRVSASPARARTSEASAPATVAPRSPKSMGSHEKSAPTALPHTLSPDVVGRTGPDSEGKHRLRQDLTGNVVDRRAVRLPEGIETGEIGCLGHVNAGRRDIDLLERGPDRRIVIDGVLNRPIQGERLRRLFARGLRPAPGRRHRGGSKNGGRQDDRHAQAKRGQSHRRARC